jgi:phosphoglycolate phosphatase-like HAD superfamily hydrolase
MSTSSPNRGRLALDLDGTLIDPRPRQVAALAALLDPALEIDGDRLWELKRDGLTTRQALVRLGLDAEVARGLSERWVATVEDPGWLLLDRLLPGVADALGALAAAGTRPLILTARQDAERARDQVAALGLLRWCAEVEVVSPNAAVEEKAVQLVARGCRAFVGDTESDARAAAIAGVDFAAVTSGQRSPEFLLAAQLPSFETLAEALRALGEGPQRL